MATRENDVGPNAGVLGYFTIYQRQGKTIVRPRHNNGGGKKRTLKTMSCRTKTGNLVAVWRSFGKQLCGTFAKQKACSTDYSGFMSANERASEVRLTKAEADSNFSIAGPYVVSQGLLTPSIEVEREEEWMVSDIKLGNNEIDEKTRVSSIASALVYNNEGRLLFGDTLTFVRLTQRELKIRYKDMEKQYRVAAEVHQLVLRADDDRPLGVALGLTEVGDGWSVRNGRLAASRREGSFVAWTRSRKGADGKVQASTQKLVGESAIYDYYSSWEQREKAVGSYGQLEENFYKTEVPLWEQKGYDQYVTEMKERQRKNQEKRQREVERQQEEQRQQELERQREEKEYDENVEGMIDEATNPTNVVVLGDISADCLPPEGGRVEIMPPAKEEPDHYFMCAMPEKGWRFQCWSNGDTSVYLEPPVGVAAHFVAFFCEK